MRRPVAILALTTLLLGPGCIKLDFLFFEADRASSIEGDYHGLPLHLGQEPPLWIDEMSIEREIHVAVPTAEAIEPSRLAEHTRYIHGVFLPAPTSCPAVECPLVDRDLIFVFQHGNSGHLWRYWYRAVALWSMGASVFVYTYRGYGLSSGEASAEHVLQDADTALAYVLDRPERTATTRIAAYGYSMGAIPTSYLIGASPRRGEIDAAVLESGLDDPQSIVSLSTGTDFPAGYFLEADGFDGPAFAARAAPDLPILHVHGGRDRRVIPEQAERYTEALRGRPGFTSYLGRTDREHESWIREAGHRNVPHAAFLAEHHIADYWGHPANPGHCCVHPDEFADPRHQAFLEQVGQTSGPAMTRSAGQYRALVSGWILEQLGD